MKSGELRHVADIYEPFNDTDSRGSVDPFAGKPYIPKVPCSIKQIASGEQDAANQTYAAATYEVQMYADRKKPLAHTYWLSWDDGTLSANGERQKKRLEIGSAVLDERGSVYTLTCREVLA